MREPFNQLTPAQAERLALLAEECGELIQAIGKVLRHGYESVNPFAPEMGTNRDMVERECGDVRYAMIALCEAGDLSKEVIHAQADCKRANVKQYMHHQEKP
jgi:NTP pyrophosphatase (non-canonical NTP hydrolase)